MISDPRLDRASTDIHEADYRVTEDGSVERAPSRSRRGWLAPLTAGLLFVATKFKFLLVALKGIPFFTTGLTAIVSIGACALAFSWQFAVGRSCSLHPRDGYVSSSGATACQPPRPSSSILAPSSP
jgi:hypothetical protein